MLVAGFLFRAYIGKVKSKYFTANDHVASRRRAHGCEICEYRFKKAGSCKAGIMLINHAELIALEILHKI